MQLKSKGFTLVELLVVIAIIGILIGMLLPAVQQVREAARRSACQNNLRQLALACHNYESGFMRFPPGCNWNNSSGDDKRNESILAGGERMAWSVFIMPYLEQNNLHDAFKSATNSWSDDWWLAVMPSSGLPCASQVVPGFICKSDDSPEGDFNSNLTQTAAGAPFAKSNYVAICGAGNNNSGDPIEIRGDMDHFNASTDVNSGGSNSTTGLWGVFAKNSKTTFGEITDGTSNCLIFGERATRTNRDSGSTGSLRPGGAVWAGVGNSNGSYPNTGGNISKDWHVFGHMFSEDPANWGVNGRDTPRGVASSYHPGGANGALGDGSVRFLGDDLNVAILADVVRMSDGNVVSGF